MAPMDQQGRMRMKKKIISIIALLAVSTVCFAGCGKEEQVTGTCDMCGYSRPLYKVVAGVPDNMMEDHVCKPCADRTQEMYNGLEKLGIESSCTITVYTGK